MISEQINAHMRGLLDDRYNGDQYAMTRAISDGVKARRSPGTISRRLSGEWEWTFKDAFAAAAAVGDDRFYRVLLRYCQDKLKKHRITKNICMIQRVGRMSKESGEAFDAVLQAELEGKSPKTIARAIKELDEAIAELTEARDVLAENSTR